MEYEELISIIVPIYNVEKYLAECVNSIMNQSYKHIEIILVDDGSTDNSGRLCEQFRELDNRIIVVHKENGGLSSARNAGIENSHGNMFMFIDSDDYIGKDMASKLYETMIKYKADMSICNMNRVFDDGTIKPFYNITEAFKCLDGDKRFETLSQPSVCNKMFRKRLFENIRFPEGKYYEDTYIYHELAYNANKIGLVNYNGYWYRLRSNSILGDFQYNDKYFDAIDAVWQRANFLISHNVQPYGDTACLSLYAYFANAEKYIAKTDKNRDKFLKAKQQYLLVYKHLKCSNVNLKQRIRLILLRYSPKIHSKLY